MPAARRWRHRGAASEDNCGMTDPRTGWESWADAGRGRRVHSRAELLKRSALLGGAALTAGGVATGLARSGTGSLTARDERILNYVLRLERLKEAFYREAVEQGSLPGELQQLAGLLARHEHQHVAFLSEHLQGRAEAAKTYSFGDATRDPQTFSAVSHKLEEAAVAAYIGQGANLSRALMVPFAQVTSVEARHAAWISDVLGSDPAPRAADKAKAPEDVLATIDALGFETDG